MHARGLQRFGSYLLVRPLGRGGMGEVFLARASFAHNPVAALKRLRRDVARVPTFAERFKHEADLAVLLRHPNVVQTLEVGAHEEQPYVASALVLGKDTAVIADRLRERGQGAPAAVVVRILLDVLAALAYVHGARDGGGRFLGLVHRDVTPGNVLLGYDGLARLADFGLAKSALTEAANLTGHGEIIGTPHYLAPEVIRGESAQKTADVYGLAAVTYRVLTGIAPFQGTTAEVLFKALSEKPRDLREWRPDLPEWFTRFVHEMLEQDASRRPFDAELLSHRLEHEAKEHKLLLGRDSVGRWLKQLFDEEREREEQEYEAIAAIEPEDALEHHEGTVVLARVQDGRSLEAPASIPSGAELDTVGTELDFAAESIAKNAGVRRGADVPVHPTALSGEDFEALPTFAADLGRDTRREASGTHLRDFEPDLHEEQTRAPSGVDLLDPDTFSSGKDDTTGKDSLPGFVPASSLNHRPPVPASAQLADAASVITDLDVPAGAAKKAKETSDDRGQRGRAAAVPAVAVPVRDTKETEVPPTLVGLAARPPEDRASAARAEERAVQPASTTAPDTGEPPRPVKRPTAPPAAARTPAQIARDPALSIERPRRARARSIVTVLLSVALAIGSGIGIGLWLSEVRSPTRAAVERDRLVTRFNALKAEIDARTAKNEEIAKSTIDLLNDAATALLNGDLERARSAIEQLERLVGPDAPRATRASLGDPSP
ncbi:MAG: serine/threonine protein kinase [Deltaproteobacteria bacterium]|nr:serine/threonine protein kinase [Deltaproteobacteria bacterium]